MVTVSDDFLKKVSSPLQAKSSSIILYDNLLTVSVPHILTPYYELVLKETVITINIKFKLLYLTIYIRYISRKGTSPSIMYLNNLPSC